MVNDPAIACANVVKASRSNFALAFRFLPRDQREGMNAIYAFCRRTDDIADGAGPVESKREALKAWRAELTDRGQDPIIRAVVGAIGRFDIDPAHLHAVIDGCEMDLDVDRIATFEELKRYCSLVAGAVGHLCMGVWGVAGERAAQCAEDLGLAVQLTNILRDVGTDALLGRIYLPLEMLEAHHVDESDILQRKLTPGVVNVLEDLAARSHAAYRRADLGQFERRIRRRLWPSFIISKTYHCLLRRIEEQGFPIFEKRVKIGKPCKLRFAMQGLIMRVTG